MLYNSEKIRAAIEMITKKGRGNTEDYVTRYVMMILQNHFDLSNTWNMVPKIRSHAQKFPDLALETLRTHTDKSKTLRSISMDRIQVIHQYVSIRSS